MKYFFILFFIFVKIIYSREKSLDFQWGFLQTSTSTYYKDGQNKEIPIQNMINIGIPLHFTFVPDSFYLINLNQIYLYSLYIKEDKEVLYKNQNDISKLFLYNKNNSFLGIFYKNFFILMGYINPYESLLEKYPDPFNYHIFPSIDFRINLNHHIFTFSPYFIFEKEQLFNKYDEDQSFIIHHYYLKENQYDNNQNQAYKLHYSFISKYILFYFGYYYYNQKNFYSNLTNFLELNFYDYHIIFNYSNISIKSNISVSKGIFKKGEKPFFINGNKYQISFSLFLFPFYFYLEGTKTTKSKWNYFNDQWEYFGYTSIFDEFILTPQLSSTFIINPNYEICINTDHNCEGINFIDNEIHFKTPSDTLYLKIKYFYSIFEFILSSGLIKKEIYAYEENFNSINKKKINQYYYEPNFQILIKDPSFKFIVGYSEFYKRQNKLNFISKNIQLSFIYYI
jgi:hypothetical protein